MRPKPNPLSPAVKQRGLPAARPRPAHPIHPDGLWFSSGGAATDAAQWGFARGPGLPAATCAPSRPAHAAASSRPPAAATAAAHRGPGGSRRRGRGRGEGRERRPQRPAERHPHRRAPSPILPAVNVEVFPLVWQFCPAHTCLHVRRHPAEESPGAAGAAEPAGASGERRGHHPVPANRSGVQ